MRSTSRVYFIWLALIMCAYNFVDFIDLFIVLRQSFWAVMCFVCLVRLCVLRVSLVCVVRLVCLRARLRGVPVCC